MFFFIVMCISGIYALANQTTNGTFSTSIVDIEIQTFKLDNDNNEVEYNDEDKKVMPGDVISLIPKICNLGEDCYLRFKVNYYNENTDFIDYVEGFTTEFSKYGEND